MRGMSEKSEGLYSDPAKQLGGTLESTPHLQITLFDRSGRSECWHINDKNKVQNVWGWEVRGVKNLCSPRNVCVTIKHRLKGELLPSSRIARQDQACKRPGGPSKRKEKRQTSHSAKEQITEPPRCPGLDPRTGLNTTGWKLKWKSCFKKAARPWGPELECKELLHRSITGTVQSEGWVFLLLGKEGEHSLLQRWCCNGMCMQHGSGIGLGCTHCDPRRWGT